ncbi:MAG: DUF2062 domain-containing protein [Prevotellaceae bacterium]|jgi:glycosyltransferase involved in cell wall biosynthesis|nr:DUF2062 domain-containing protein [Prevotellaceae bacterium]
MSNSSWHNRLKELGVIAIIPAYNNDKTLATVIEGVSEYCQDIIVVNDGSTDETANILSKFQDIQIITHPKNKGKGRALKNGLLVAQEQGFRYAITIDSDGQHYPSDIPIFIEEIEKQPDSLLVGARNLTADNMPTKNTFANKFSNFWFRVETGKKLVDTQSGYRLYPLLKIGKMKGYTTKYEFELEIIVFSSWKGIPVKNIPVRVYYPPEGERVSHFHPFRDFFRISVVNTTLVLIAFFGAYPKRFFKALTWTNIKKFIHNHIVHSPDSNIRITLSVMLGIFMGIVPVWGYQMLLALLLAQLLKLNKVIALVASNISIPPMIPFILYGSYVTGCLTLGRSVNLVLSDISLENIANVLTQYFVGSFIFAAICSITIGLITFGLLSIFRKRPQSLAS